LEEKDIDIATGQEAYLDGEAAPNEYVRGAFRAKDLLISLRSNPSLYDTLHEVAHALHALDYIDLLGKEAGIAEYELLSKLEKEQMVFDTLVNSEYWKQFTQFERDHAVAQILQYDGSVPQGL
jgi:hypothetical protein